MLRDQTISPPVRAALRTTRNRAADMLLVEALPIMEAESRSGAMELLLTRAYEPALAALVAGFARYDDDLRSRMISNIGGLHPGVRRCLADARVDARLNAVTLIGRSGDYRLAYLLAEALTQNCRETTKQSAQTLLALAASLQTETATSARVPDPRAADCLVAAVRQALGSWRKHLRPEVLSAAALLVDRLEGTILTLVGNTRSRIHHAFTAMLDNAGEVELAGLALRLLRAAPTQKPAAKWISRAADERMRSALLAESWLLADEAVAHSCVRVRSLPCLDRDPSVVLLGSDGVIHSAIRLMCACGLRPAVKVNWLQQLARSNHPTAARAAIWALIHHRLEGGDEALVSLAGQVVPPLSEVIRLELHRRGVQTVRAAEQLQPTDIAAPAARAAESFGGFEPYWAEFDAIPPADRVRIGRLVRQITPAFDRLLRAQLAGSKAEDRRRALRIVRELELSEAFEETVYRAAADPDSVVRTMAVDLLGGINTVASHRILRGALYDPDGRVQANAVEALDKLGLGDNERVIAPKLASGHSRVRANAVNALLRMRVRDAAETLIDMLASQDTNARISALWVVERLGLQGVLTRVSVMADADPDERVQRRAQRVLTALEVVALDSPEEGFEPTLWS